jgi:cytochrome P450
VVLTDKSRGSFLDTRDDKRQPLSLEYIKAEMLFIIIAGADTTGTAFQSLLMHLLTEPAVYEKVMAEIDEATIAGHLSRDMPQLDEVVAHCPYYIACVKESLRLNPPVPAQFPRLVPEGGLDIDGRFIPAGTEIACNVWVVQHDARLYGPDVDVFRPERWLEDPDRAREFSRLSFVFGFGSRQCIGRDIAYMELYKAPLQFLRTFRAKFVDPSRPGRLAGRGDICFFQDMWMTLERREWPRR